MSGEVEGKRMRTLVERVLPLHTEEFAPFRKRITVPFSPIQEELFERGKVEEENASRSSRMKYLMGKFYEYLTRGFYGGKLMDVKHSWVFGDGKVRPDVYDQERGIVIESKSSVKGHRLAMGEKQFKGYQHGQFLHPEMQFFYAIHRHVFEGVESTQSEQEVFEGLIRGTAFSMLIPLSIFVEMAKKELEGVSAFYRNGDAKWNDNLLIHSPTINRLLVEPISVIQEIGLNPENYSFSRYLSPVDATRVNGKMLRPAYIIEGRRQFPILKIENRTRDIWVEEFLEKYEGHIEREAIKGNLEILPEFSLEKRKKPGEKPFENPINTEDEEDLPF